MTIDYFPIRRSIMLPIEWEEEIRDIEFLIVPELRQEFYYGIDFSKTFGLSITTKSGNTNSSHYFDAMEAKCMENVNNDICLNSAHQLTDTQLNFPDKIKKTVPSFEKYGLCLS